ncbi:MAG: TIGR00282 family metallophosphoesterase [Candidatus Aureabacteria bacterium]|nr:TIGR00282 family metallophosphoesterase [Candidatus Auribacterota bacterium]
MTILFCGDIVGNPGRKAIRELLPRLKAAHEIDFVVANAENAAGGSGVTAEVVEELIASGVNALTSGDHIWRNKGVYDILGRDERLLRPANYPDGAPGHGSFAYELPRGLAIGVVNVVGRIFMSPLDCPFRAARSAVEALRARTPLILVDVHAEATSEKMALGRYLDGTVTAIAGTHTHVQTADEQVLPGGTAFITDIGMTGPTVSILGREIEPVLKHFLTQMPHRFDVAREGIELQGVIIRADETTGRAVGIERVREKLE